MHTEAGRWKSTTWQPGTKAGSLQQVTRKGLKDWVTAGQVGEAGSDMTGQLVEIAKGGEMNENQRQKWMNCDQY